MGDHEQRDPALTGVGDDARYGDPRENPIAFIPTDEPTVQPWDPGRTDLIPAVGRIEYQDAVDYDNTDLGEISERIDGWCEDRPVLELTDEDGID